MKKIFCLNLGSCLGCDSELKICESVGFTFTKNLKKCDIVAITGVATPEMSEEAMKLLKDKKNKHVVAIGTCSLSKGLIFKKDRSPSKADARYDAIFAANIYVYGCPPTPSEIIRGMRKVLSVKK